MDSLGRLLLFNLRLHSMWTGPIPTAAAPTGFTKNDKAKPVPARWEPAQIQY